MAQVVAMAVVVVSEPRQTRWAAVSSICGQDRLHGTNAERVGEEGGSRHLACRPKWPSG